MRARNIKPGFFHNEALAECSVQARLLFPGLWMVADRKGRLEYRPKKIKILVFPADDVDCEKLLNELIEVELIRRYEIGGKGYIWIPTFLTHQNPHRNEKQSLIPPHPDELKGMNSEKAVELDLAQGSLEQLSNPNQGQPKAQLGAGQGQTPVEPKQGATRLNPESRILTPESRSLNNNHKELIDGEREKLKKTKAVFKPPTLKDVSAYSRERKNNVDPEQFVDHYESNGWMVGKNRMKDWKAAVRTWEKNSFGQLTKGKGFDDFNDNFFNN